MVEGFKIICLNCGKEVILTNGNFKNDEIDVTVSSQWEDIDITCQCGNDTTN